MPGWSLMSRGTICFSRGPVNGAVVPLGGALTMSDRSCKMAPHKGGTMNLQRLVTERKQGSLDRRQFLACLGATAAGAVVTGARSAAAQKKITVTMWDTEPNPATRTAVKAI